MVRYINKPTFLVILIMGIIPGNTLKEVTLQEARTSSATQKWYSIDSPEGRAMHMQMVQMQQGQRQYQVIMAQKASAQKINQSSK